MADNISAVINRFAALIGGVADIGRVHKHDVRDRDDIRRWIVSTIDGVDMIRAWWISGPVMESRWLTSMSPRFVVRRFTFEVHGIEGMTPGFDGDTREPGEDLQTLRDFTVEVSDALDNDTLDLAASSFASEPCVWRQAPRHEMFGPPGSAFGAAHAVIEKQITTMPARP